ncbi:MAG TPA: hypothetical protein VJ651_13085 [Noviherbaspirillum sp.]|nr:hypothetical protein [Noviherbaspirillum sp.]HJV81758.1 hypothetical protein [Noviherbaspirillum sp.]
MSRRDGIAIVHRHVEVQEVFARAMREFSTSAIMICPEACFHCSVSNMTKKRSFLIIGTPAQKNDFGDARVAGPVYAAEMRIKNHLFSIEARNQLKKIVRRDIAGFH